MKKYSTLVLIALSTLILISWGFEGHKVTALIAEDNLTPQAKSAVKDLLGNQSLADVASWADDVRNTAAYKYTAPYHFLNVELGMDYDQFVKTVKALPGDNVYTAINKYEAELKSPSTSREEKAVALKFLVHFIGDAHQPMHISRAADKGGNTIQVQFLGKGTNLHSLWDSGLLNHEGLTDEQLHDKLKKQLNPSTDYADYQHADKMHWLFESYTLSSQLYQEIEQSNKLDEGYYNKYIALVNERLCAGGLRLAGVLNNIFKDYKLSGIAAPSPPNSKMSITAIIDIKDVAKHIGENINVQAVAFSSRDMGSMILVNLGAAYPNQLMTVVLRGDARALAKDMDNTMVSVTGTVIDYKGKPEILIDNPVNFRRVPMVGEGHSGRRIGG